MNRDRRFTPQLPDKLTAKCEFRITEAEKQRLGEQGKILGMSGSEYARYLILQALGPVSRESGQA